jgi:hypothetical protein
VCAFYPASISNSLGVVDDIEVVHTDLLACVAIVNLSIWMHDGVKCLMSLYLLDYDFLSMSRDGFVSVIVKPMENHFESCHVLS